MSTTTNSTDPRHPSGLPGTEHETGNSAATLTLVEYGDYECPRCAQAEPATRHLVETFGDRLRFVFRHFPDAAAHPHAELAAEAAEAAAAQGKFWQMHARLFSQPQHLKPAALAQHAEALELDMVRFHAEMADHVYLQRVREHHAAGVQLGLRGTPSFFLNDELVDVSFGLEHLERAVLAALGNP
ncbi:protein-disulfide isomerase [Actimicrobium sp. GrIS 1.19]|uniref:DsbA family protein n=1 Tax=Actimicrobium sp. GrIS 1.19 TaxID=3071708 RepID=UPI002DFD6A95|nr:protein-disulfide isomerase [Actimicrobium sp. GrIS 1.19]